MFKLTLKKKSLKQLSDASLINAKHTHKIGGGLEDISHSTKTEPSRTQA
ncbi:hypothetical protein [Pseudoalteromonas xiamenensis]|uniref:Uncharacterized protein n=1 Tax=Pseudoalteromonas xiamenensis TaxID=882626 RepID=A0A975DFV3_9GAMM|nr:hypothetical protein [Pseudoalteromonas xiamenensis]QTH70342.1 hypothetical protein J5O05_09965 [Pseudoalteromonas xiamenensis]WMN58608.1 hypothetical protein NI389_10095 [Pseudoalteromonas xiamenensis]